MLQILYLLIEGLAVIVPALLAVAFILLSIIFIYYFILSLEGKIIYNIRFLKFSIIFLLLTLLNNYLYFENVFNFIVDLHYNKNLIINLIVDFYSIFLILVYFMFKTFNNGLLYSTIPIIPLNLVNRFSSSSNNSNINNITNGSSLNPWFITGFTDGEGSFYFSIVRCKTCITGWSVIIGFNLVAANNPANLKMFSFLPQFFGVGKIIFAKDNSYFRYVVNGLTDCLILRNHFINYPLLSYKLVHFKLWCQVLDILLAKEHLTLKGLLKIIALKAHSPQGLSILLKNAFPDYIPIPEPLYDANFTLLNINWLAGFINADGSFGLFVQNEIECRFRILITQHANSLSLLNAICAFLGVGKVYLGSKSVYTFRIFNLAGVNAFISKFNEATMLGAKALDYTDFCKGIAIINTKEHLTKNGLALFIKIASGMNSKRTYFGESTSDDN